MYEHLIWEWDGFGGIGFNALGMFETTLLNFGLADEYANIDDSDVYVNIHYIEKEHVNE